jgi:uncharacterized membrane protein YhiD involved in acid resistance
MDQLRAFLADNLANFSFNQIPIFLFSLLVCTVLTYLLGRLYVRFGHSLTNRASFARNFLLLAIATMFIISVVKSSLALSLGLVGALSIVRFRSAIKEPEELIYLFLAISIGLGCGAGLSVLTIIGFCGFACVIWFNHRMQKESETQSLYLTISSQQATKTGVSDIIEILKKHAGAIKLKRSDETSASFEVSFFVNFANYESLAAAKKDLLTLDPSVSVTFMDSSRDL